MEPIVLTEFGDTLRFDSTVGVTDKSPIGEGTLWHNHKCYPIQISSTPTHYRLACRGCGTIVVVHNDIKTYGMLSQWCIEYIARVKELMEATVFI